jgi:hypothetical protein
MNPWLLGGGLFYLANVCFWLCILRANSLNDNDI